MRYQSERLFVLGSFPIHLPSVVGTLYDLAVSSPAMQSISLRPTFRPEIVYVGNVPIQVFPLPLPPNPIVARLQSFGFLLQVPMIKSPGRRPSRPPIISNF